MHVPEHLTFTLTPFTTPPIRGHPVLLHAAGATLSRVHRARIPLHCIGIYLPNHPPCPLNHLIAKECKTPLLNLDQSLDLKIHKIQRCLGLGFSGIEQIKRGCLQIWESQQWLHTTAFSRCSSSSCRSSATRWGSSSLQRWFWNAPGEELTSSIGFSFDIIADTCAE